MILLAPDAISDLERLRTFLDEKSPIAGGRAIDAIWASIERLDQFPLLGMPTSDRDIRQIIIRFGAAGYIVRYAVLPSTRDVLIIRIWHGREQR